MIRIADVCINPFGGKAHLDILPYVNSLSKYLSQCPVQPHSVVWILELSVISLECDSPEIRHPFCLSFRVSCTCKLQRVVSLPALHSEGGYDYQIGELGVQGMSCWSISAAMWIWPVSLDIPPEYVWALIRWDLWYRCFYIWNAILISFVTDIYQVPLGRGFWHSELSAKCVPNFQQNRALTRSSRPLWFHQFSATFSAK